MAETLPDQEMCDEQLCRLAASGDRWAEGVLISRYLGMVRRFAAGRRGALDFDDLVQEGCIGLLDAIAGFDPSREAKFSTYAYACIRNRVSRALQQAGGQAPPALPLEAGEKADGRDPGDLLIFREQLELARALLADLLTPLERKIFFAHLGGFSYQAIAASLDISEKSVDNALQRAKRKLRKVKR